MPRKTWWSLAALAVMVALVAAGCGSSNNSSTSTSGGAAASTSGGGGKVNGSIAVLLPDTQSSVRWEQFDRKYLDQAFTAAGIKHTITNAQGDPGTQRTQAEQALTNGAKVILLVDLDPGSGKSIIQLAHARGAKVIDYDRLTLGGGADYYVSFDNVKVGKLQGQGLVNCIKQKGLKNPVVAELNGSPTDNNATLFAQGYNSVLDPMYKNGTFKKGPNQSVPDWDNQKALTIYEQMLQSTKNNIQAVLSANDGLANSVISAETSHKVPYVPVTGQDATSQGIQHILAGQQCMTVYKAVKKEADAAAQVAIALAKGQTPNAPAQTKNGSQMTPSVLLTPVAVTKKNINQTVIKDGFLTKSQICVGQFAKDCAKAGL
ncbi:MAG TPA: substrate-binding domain-containing protein [Thermoleophilaceae bacterium]|nr:substrate-binding domain-containing protein [Thermoleophilaceae bacterium]